MMGPPAGGRVPQTVHPLIAVGGQKDLVRVDEDDDSAHDDEDGPSGRL